MTIDYLKNKIKKLPQKSGVYTFKGLNGKCLYVGKAVNLKNRLLSYRKTENIRIQKMLSLAKSLEHIATNSDIEALILESQLIKKFLPPFNIVMRDDKQYSFVVFTDEKYQKIFTTHQPHAPNFKFKILNSKLKSADADFIGPFTDAGSLKTTLRLLRRIFPYCTCRQLHYNYCLNYHIEKCPGICCLKQQSRIFNLKFSIFKEKEYRKNIKAIKGILTGKKNSIIKNLEKEMTLSAKNGDLEKAIELRRKLGKLKRVFENAKIIRNTNNSEKTSSGLKSLSRILKLKHKSRRIEGYDISNIQGTNATGAMVVFTNEKPDKNQYRKFKIHTKYTTGQFQHHNGRGNIEIQNGGDTGMLREILERRFKHNEWPFPDLILIDGGKAQLNAAHSVISNYYTTLLDKQRAPLLIALTKDEKHRGSKVYISGQKSPLSLDKLSPTDKNLLLQINSEAHRFAISYYRKLHRKLFK